jgi:hypothetical protein
MPHVCVLRYKISYRGRQRYLHLRSGPAGNHNDYDDGAADWFRAVMFRAGLGAEILESARVCSVGYRHRVQHDGSLLRQRKVELSESRKFRFHC